MNALRILAAVFLLAMHAAAQITSTKTTFDAPANFAPGNESVDLVVSNGKRTFKFLWSYQTKEGNYLCIPCELKAGEVYTFTLDEERAPFAEGFSRQSNPEERMIKATRLSKIEQAGKVVFDREACEIHRRKMERKEVPIIFGLVSAPTGKQPSRKESQTLFPHHSEQVFGGCIVGPVKTEVKFVCPDCKAAHEQWKRENGVK